MPKIHFKNDDEQDQDAEGARASPAAAAVRTQDAEGQGFRWPRGEWEAPAEGHGKNFGRS